MSGDLERERRWRLLLGGGPADGLEVQLSGDDVAIDQALAALYDSERRGSLGKSAPSVPRWLGDIRRYFPSSVVQVLQKDALDRLGLTQMLTEPELLESVVPDVHLVATLISMRGVMPVKTRETARLVVQKVVDELMAKLEAPMRDAVYGALDRSIRNLRPRHNEIDWPRTIRANLRHYQQSLNTIIPEKLLGHGRKRSKLKNIILCVDQSGSMAASVVYSSIFGAVMASLPAISTHLVVFDTAIVDLTDTLDDPLEALFSIQLGGGTDINRAISYCQSLIARPSETILVLISDLFEGGVREELLQRTSRIVQGGTTMITLLALSDEGRPAFDHQLGAELAALGAPSFACTPDLFPDLMATAIAKRDLQAWAAQHHAITTRPDGIASLLRP